MVLLSFVVPNIHVVALGGKLKVDEKFVLILNAVYLYKLG